MAQQGQVFKLKGNGRNGSAVWAYRYRVNGRGSKRPQVGGFATRAEAQEALRRALDRLRPDGRAATLTLGELVEEYLDVHQAEPTTIAKLRWLLAKATCVLGEVRVVDLRPEQVCAWRASLPEGSSRFAATQALRQVLNRAIAWELIDFNPAKRGVDNPSRRCQETRPFESWAEIDAVAEQLCPAYGPMVVFAAATGLRPAELFALEQRDVDRAAGVVYVRRAFAYGQLKKTKTRSMRAVPLQSIALEALAHLPGSKGPAALPRASWRLHRSPQLPQAALEAGTDRGRHRPDPPTVRPASHVRDVRAPCRHLDLRPLAVHGCQPGHDRSALRPPRPRRSRAREGAAGHARRE